VRTTIQFKISHIVKIGFRDCVSGEGSFDSPGTIQLCRAASASYAERCAKGVTCVTHDQSTCIDFRKGIIFEVRSLTDLSTGGRFSLLSFRDIVLELSIFYQKVSVLTGTSCLRLFKKW
jgi:hypothetical protein